MSELKAFPITVSDEEASRLTSEYAELGEPSSGFIEVADRMCDLYVTYRGRFVIMVDGRIFIPKYNGAPMKLRNSNICHHLNRSYSISIYAGQYSSKFVCFDVDAGGLSTVQRVVTAIVHFGIPREYIVVSSSGGKGYHVEVFFDDLVYTENLAKLYDFVTIEAGVSRHEVEFRPTYTQAIKLPLSRHYKTGNICWYLDPETFEPIESIEYILTIQKFSRDGFNDLVSKLKMRKPIEDPYDPINKYLDKEPPKQVEISPEVRRMMEASIYPRLEKQGERHHMMMRIAIHNRTLGMTQEESYETLERWWNEQDQSVSGTSTYEALSDASSLVAWTFSEHFTPPKKKEPRLTITEQDMDIVLAQKTRTERKIMFLIICYCSVFGKLKMSKYRIAETVGCSTVTVMKAIRGLVESRWLYVRFGTPSFDAQENTFKRECNSYRVSGEASKKAREVLDEIGIEQNICDDFFPYDRVLTINDDNKLEMPELKVDGFMEFYREALSHVTKKTLRKRVTRLELNWILKSNGNTDIENDTKQEDE